MGQIQRWGRGIMKDYNFQKGLNFVYSQLKAIVSSFTFLKLLMFSCKVLNYYRIVAVNNSAPASRRYTLSPSRDIDAMNTLQKTAETSPQVIEYPAHRQS
jgi:hypothetical protein